MRVIKFNKNKHFQALLSILRSRGAYLPSVEEMPRIGFVAMQGTEIIAISSLRVVEGGWGMIDGLTSNPEFSPQIRDVALDAVVRRCLEQAKKANINTIIALSKDDNTMMRSQKFGFVKCPLTPLVADLRGTA